jgi:hypothetical protein
MGGASPAIARRAPVPRQNLLADGAEDEGACGEHRHLRRSGRPGRGHAGDGRDERRRQAARRTPGRALASVARRHAMTGPTPEQQDEHQRQRDRVAVEPRRADGLAVAGQRLGDEREERAPEDDEGQADEHEVVGDEHRLAREQRVERCSERSDVAARDDQRDRPMIIVAIRTRNGMPSVEAPNAWIESRIPLRTRNVPSTHSVPVARISEAFHTFSMPRASPGA